MPEYIIARDGSLVEIGQGCLGGWFARQDGVKLYEDRELACRHDGEAFNDPIPLTARRVAMLVRKGIWVDADVMHWLGKLF